MEKALKIYLDDSVVFRGWLQFYSCDERDAYFYLPVQAEIGRAVGPRSYPRRRRPERGEKGGWLKNTSIILTVHPPSPLGPGLATTSVLALRGWYWEDCTSDQAKR